LSWGPYFWSYPDGTPRQHDGFVWSIADVAPDGLHPSLSGLTKYANMLLRQMTTDPTATPWFMKSGAPPNKPPTIARVANADADPVSGGTTALSVLGADDGGEPNLTYTWSSTGPAGVTFSVNGPNRAKNTMATFPSAGRYTFQVTIADAGGLAATSSIVVTVTDP
jgi:hypothetical protein